MEKVHPITARVIETCKHHFIMEWQGTAVPKGATLGGNQIGISAHPNMLHTPKEIVLGYYVVMDRPVEANGNWRILVGTDHERATNPDGKPCKKASPEEIAELKEQTAFLRRAVPVEYPAASAANVGSRPARPAISAHAAGKPEPRQSRAISLTRS